jgi:hypothetical protein
VMHYEAEVRWHDELDAELAATPEPRAALLPNEASEARPGDEPAAPASSAPKADETTDT